MDSTDLKSELLTPEDVAQVLGIGRTKIYAMFASGELPALRIGRLIRVPRRDLDRWIADNVEPSRSDQAA